MIQPFFINRDRCLRVIIFLIITMGCTINSQIGITYSNTFGWFGDQTIQYIKAKWLAYKYGLTFYFQPFSNAGLLTAYSKEKTLAQANHFYKKHINVNHESDIANNLQDGTLFILQPYARGYEFNTEDLINYLLVNSPQNFLMSISALLQPAQTILLPAIPSNLITVGVHIRKPFAGDYPLHSDQLFNTSPYNTIDEKIVLTNNKKIQSKYFPSVKKEFERYLYSDINSGPMKFPPTQYYIDQIKKLSVFFNDAPMFVHLFSCYPNQTELYNIVKKGVNKNNIIYAQDVIQWSSNLIDDHYAMSKYDCLIKSISSFSSIAQLAGNHAICIVPNQYFWDNTKLVVNKSSWFIRDEELNNIKNKASLAAK